jgi:hypothetical protein
MDDADDRLVGIAHYYASWRSANATGQLFRNQNCPGPGRGELGGIAAGDRERKSRRAGPAERPDRVDAYVPVAKQAATDEIGDRLRGKAPSSHAASCPL